MTLDLTDQEAAALARHLRQTLDYTRYPFAPRLEPPEPQPTLAESRHGAKPRGKEGAGGVRKDRGGLCAPVLSGGKKTRISL